MIYTTQRRRFVYDRPDNGSRLDGVMVECTLSITHCLRLNLQLHTVDLVRTCRISNLSSFCTVAWQLAIFQLTRRIARSLGDSWASCCSLLLSDIFVKNYQNRLMYVEVIERHISVTFWDTVWNWNAPAFRYIFMYACQCTIYRSEETFYSFTVYCLLL